jgi:hypothetical protein
MLRPSLIAMLVAALSQGTWANAQQPLPPPQAVPILPAPLGPQSNAAQPNPFAPLPEGAIIGPGGPMMPGPPATPRNAVVIPPIDAELVWTKLVDVTDDFFKVHSEQRVVFAKG